MKQCPVRDLTFGNVGGHVWSQVKADQNFIPPFSILKRAPLWAEESRFKDTVWRWLCEGAEDWAIKEAEQLETKEGAVMSVDVQVGRATAKLMWGDVVPVLRTRSQTEVLLFEINNENQPLSSEAIAAIGIAGRQKTGVRIIVWGPPAVVEALKKGVLLKLMEASNPLYNYKTKEVIACVPQDEAGGPRPKGYTMCFRTVLLLAPGAANLRPIPPILVSHVGWRPTLIGHLLASLDLAGGVFTGGGSIGVLCRSVALRPVAEPLPLVSGP